MYPASHRPPSNSWNRSGAASVRSLAPSLSCSLVPCFFALLLPCFVVVHLLPCSLAPLFPVFRLERVGEEGIENVCEQQLLVLLFMVHAQLDTPQGFFIRTTFEEPLHRAIYMLAVAKDLVEARPRER